jgi:hypothetical protein
MNDNRRDDNRAERNGNGAPKYDAALYGLSAAAIDERFAAYRRAFAHLL